MHIVALKSQLAEMLPRLRPVGQSDGWTTRFVDPVTGKRWTRIHLGADHHGGGQPVLVPDPTPTVADLLEIVGKSEDPAQIAASAWILAETDTEGSSREELLMLAESAASGGDKAKGLLHLTVADPLLRDPGVFEG